MTDKPSYKNLWHPSSWGTLFFVGLCFVFSLIPQTKHRFVAKWLLRLAKPLVRSRVGICQRNISLCFPELTTEQQQHLVDEALISYVQGFFESLYCWWRNTTPYIDDLEVEGLEHYQQARAHGRGVLVLSAHFTILDFAIPTIASQMQNGGYMYRPNNNPIIDCMIERGRRRHFGLVAFNKRQTQQMAQFLTQGGEVWYAPDQDFGPKYSKAFVPFFNVPTACITTPSRIVRETGCRIIQASQFRRPDGGYKVCFRALPDDFGQDEQVDAIAWNRGLEEEIRKHPEQYLWVHKRFKTRPEGEKSIY